jgi:gamma-glutamylcyclotransferase (GGCT)/AIG2-like uncharacterized protein YtfP
MVLIFVYGTLQRNEPNSYLMEKNNAKFVARAQTKDSYPLVICTPFNLPCLLKEQNKGFRIIGEIYEIKDDMLAEIDYLEGERILKFL